VRIGRRGGFGVRLGILGLIAGGLLALAGCAAEVDLDRLFAESQSGDTEERAEARTRLQELVREKRVDVFSRGLRSQNPETRVQAILHLMAIRTPEANEALVDELDVARRFSVHYNPIRIVPSSKPYDSRILVANILRMKGGVPRAAEVLSRGFETETDTVARTGTMYALGALHDPAGIPTLRRGLQDGDPEVFSAALESLTQLEDGELRARLLDGLRSPDPAVRGNCAAALGGFPGEETTRVLRDILRGDDSPEVRRAALGSLGSLGGRDAFEAALAVLSAAGSDPETRKAAEQALRAMSGEDLGADPWRGGRGVGAPRDPITGP
jgi:hypothetical protein